MKYSNYPFFPASAVLWHLLPMAGMSLILTLSIQLNGQPESEGAESRRIEVTSILSKISVDGVLDESVWTSAPDIGDLIQRQPTPGGSPSEKTKVTLLHDSDYLYIGIVAYDSEADKINSTEMARDASLRSDDQIEILLDPFLDKQSAFYFATNPNGALVDGLAFGNKDLNTD